jgi:hypothetical protein
MVTTALPNSVQTFGYCEGILVNDVRYAPPLVVTLFQCSSTSIRRALEGHLEGSADVLPQYTSVSCRPFNCLCQTNKGRPPGEHILDRKRLPSAQGSCKSESNTFRAPQSGIYFQRGAPKVTKTQAADWSRVLESRPSVISGSPCMEFTPLRLLTERQLDCED